MRLWELTGPIQIARLARLASIALLLSELTLVTSPKRTFVVLLDPAFRQCGVAHASARQ